MPAAYRQLENEPELNDLVSSPYDDLWDPVDRTTFANEEGRLEMKVLGLSELDNLEAPASGTDASNVSCPKCGYLAVLVAIEPAEPGYDGRTFRCSSCGHQVAMTVKIKNGSQS